MKIFLSILVFSLFPLLSFGGEGDRYGLGDSIASKNYESLSFEAAVGTTAVLKRKTTHQGMTITVRDNESATIHVWHSRVERNSRKTKPKCIDLVYRHPEQKVIITRSFYWCGE